MNGEDDTAYRLGLAEETADDYAREARELRVENAALRKALTDLADFVEQTYRQSCGLASKKEKDRAVAEHALLKPARAALSTTKPEEQG